MRQGKMELLVRCNFGGGAAKPPPPPPDPAPSDAADNLAKREVANRRLKARGYQSTILSGPQGIQKQQGKSLLGD